MCFSARSSRAATDTVPVGDLVILRGKCFATGTALFFGALSAFANSTAFNGYVQSGGNTGIDLSSIDGGSYRVTVTRAGQLNFRFLIGGQAFDSNAEAAVLDNVVTSDAYWTTRSAPAAYTESGAVRRDPLMAAASSSYNPVVVAMLGAEAQAQVQVQPQAPPLISSSITDDPGAVQFGSGATSYGSVTSADGVSGSNFYIPPQSPQSYQVPIASLIAYSTSNNSDFFYSNDNPFTITDQVPEPATFALIAGALLLVVLLRRRLVPSAFRT